MQPYLNSATQPHESPHAHWVMIANCLVLPFSTFPLPSPSENFLLHYIMDTYGSPSLEGMYSHLPTM